MHGLRAVRAGTGCSPSSTRFSERGEAAAFAVDLENPDVDGLALRDDLARILDVVRRELRDVNEALDTGKDLDERAERDDLRHATLDHVVLAIRVEHLLPGIGLRLLQAERDPLALPSMSSTFTLTVWPISSTSDGWFT